MAKKKIVKFNYRKYLNYFLLMLLIVLLCFIASRLYNIYKMNQLGESVLTRVVGNMQIDDIDSTKKELTDNNFIFISYVKSEEVQSLEKGMKKSIVNNNLQNNFLYLDATDFMLEKNYIETLNKKFALKDNNKIVELPALIYYQNGKIMKTITSKKDRMMRTDDFNMLLDQYEIIERK